MYKFTVAQRLLRNVSFNHVICAESSVSGCVKIFFVLNDKNTARLGIIVRKKIVPASTDRNRLKRIIRETFRQHSICQHSLDIVVMLRFSCRNDMEIVGNLKLMFSQIESKCVNQ